MSKGRLTPDPCVGVADLQKGLLAWLREEGTNDVWKLVRPHKEITWKTAPDAEWLTKVSGFFRKKAALASTSAGLQMINSVTESTCCYGRQPLSLGL